MLDSKSLDAISRLKLTLLIRALKGSAAELPSGNRGKKLSRSGADINTLTPKVVEYNGNNHLVLTNDVIERTNYYNKRRWLDFYRNNAEKTNSNSSHSDDSLFSESSDLDFSDDDENPFKKIRLSEILAPLYHPSEICTHPAISKTFKLGCLSTLAAELIEVIEGEQKTLNQFNRLLQVLDGEDWYYQLEENMQLPPYDHGLDESVARPSKTGIGKSENSGGIELEKISEKWGHETGKSEENKGIEENGKSGMEGSGDGNNRSDETNRSKETDRSEEIGRSEETERSEEIGKVYERGDKDGIIGNETGAESERQGIPETRLRTDLIQVTDPFFALPKSLEIFERQQQRQREDTEDDDELVAIQQELINYLQVSIQRQHEYIKNLSIIRAGLVKSEKYKKDLYRWSREMGEKK